MSVFFSNRLTLSQSVVHNIAGIEQYLFIVRITGKVVGPVVNEQFHSCIYIGPAESCDPVDPIIRNTQLAKVYFPDLREGLPGEHLLIRLISDRKRLPGRDLFPPPDDDLFAKEQIGTA